MKDNIKILEQQVHRTVDRLKELAAERKRLQSEMETLQGQLERLEDTGGGLRQVSPCTKDQVVLSVDFLCEGRQLRVPLRL